MLLFEIIRVALDSLRANKLRSLLTMLGIIIGVAAVITMLALGSGARRAVEAEIALLGTDVLTVRPGQAWFRGARSTEAELTLDDVEAVRQGAPLVGEVAPEMTTNLQVEYSNTNANLRVVGTSSNYDLVNRFEIALGRFFTPQEDEGRRRVAVLGGSVPAVLGVEAIDLVGDAIRIGNVPFEVVGVFEEKGGGGWFNRDEVILVPVETARFRLIGEDNVSQFNVAVSDPSMMSAGMAQIEQVLRRRHRLRVGDENDFWIQDRTELLGTREETTRTFTFLLASIAAVSLIVGGIGIMNIMLVSVTERTSEIGVRKALGATRRAILFQFLLEALVLCGIGGLIGIAVGISAAAVLAQAANWNTEVSAAAIALAILFSFAIGLFFGLWPANRAARLDPIAALRYE
jgi:putative ABC transport system permease protein